MNFFEHQHRARRRSAWLVLLFVLAVAAVVAATNIPVLAAFYLLSQDQYKFMSPGQWLRLNSQVPLWTTAIATTLIGGASLYRYLSLSHGGGAVAQLLGGVRVDADTRSVDNRQLLNVVEETAIAAGLPVPEVYVLPGEAGINAFAAGFTPNDAAIAVTRGMLESLTRDELQGVIAHEFSHILNSDTRLNMHLISASFGVLVVALAGRSLMRGAAEASDSRGAVFGIFIGLLLMVVGYIGVLAARLIKAAVSRDRERLADASAVQFTRNPHGLAGALKKIAISPLRQTLVAAEGEEVSHMLIASHSGLFTSLFATHPPIVERIRLLEPGFDPEELKTIRLTPMRPEAKVVTPGPMPLPEVLGLAPHMVVALVGAPQKPALDAAAALEHNLVPALRQAAHSPQDAVDVVLALILSTDNDIRQLQLQTLGARRPDAALGHIENLAGQIRRLDASQRLPLLDLAFPALRQRPLLELRQLIGLVDELVKQNGANRIFDYVLSRLLRQMLSETVTPRHAPRPAFKLRNLHAELQTLFSLLAQAGHAEIETARTACEAGLKRLLLDDAPAFAPPQPWIEPLDLALMQLDRLPPLVKQELVAALATTVLHDRQITLAESELLRVVCALLHCPLPPLAT
jgi:Zn-dependent protease with chaperone function